MLDFSRKGGFSSQDFGNLASSWWQTKAEFGVLHKLNPLRASFIEQLIDLPSTSVLDYGCGGGLLSEALAQRGALVTGADLSNENISVAKQHAEASGLTIDYLVGDAQGLLDQQQSYQLVVCLEVIEHVFEQQKLVSELVQLCQPNGLLVFSTISKSIPGVLSAKLAGEYLLKLLPAGTHDPRLFLRPSQLDKMLSNAGAESFQISGIGYNPFSEDFYLSSSARINYLLAARRL